MLLQKEIQKCKKCDLWRSRKNVVVGEGPENAKIMLIGEAPGYEEDLKGKPFVGRAGRFLNEILRKVKIDRKKIFITNVVKCRTPKNRIPKKNEILACSKFLEQQILAIKPKIICLVGNVAVSALIGKHKITKIHGRKTKVGKTIFLPTFHPAAAMRNRKLRKLFLNDLRKLKMLISDV